MKRRFALAAGGLFFILSAALLSAQTAAELERIIAIPALSYGDAAWLILSSADAAPPGTPADGAFSLAAERGWVPQNAGADTSVTLGGVSYLIMRAFNLKGGILYSAFPGPRYSYRELVYRKVIQGRAYVGLPVSGERLLRILSRALEYAGGTDESE
jgi:hypothetical protein